MADAIVGSVVDKLGSMLLDKAIQEADRLFHFNQNLSALVEKLKPFKALLKDAYQKSKRDELIQEWLLDLQDVVYDAEDLFEHCQSSLPLDIAAAAAGSAHPRPPHRCCFPWASSAAASSSAASSSSAAGSAHPHPRPRPRCSCLSWVSGAAASHLPFRYKMGKRVDELMNRITDLRERSRDFHLTQIAYSEPAFNRGTEATLHRRVFLRKESETVGIDDSIREITSWLSDEGSSHFQPRRRIAVVGMGGMGKTHLLTHLFKTESGEFEKSARLTISQSFIFKALQEMLGKEISLPVEGLTVEAARDRIFESLRGRRSLLMLDDVWHSGRQLLDDLGVPDEDGCKVIISTRSRYVAEDMGAEIYDMPSLSEKNSWILFCRHAFSSNDGVAPKELEAVAKKIAKKCRRLPLAIKTVAASMAGQRLPTQWKDALERLTEVDLSNDVMPVLEMSYQALPSHLKLCFLFCSAFPEDYEIDCNFLKALWIGEGIVCGGETTKPSDVAEGYLNDLINLCLLEATWVTDAGRAASCKMHDLLREMALGKSNEMSCFFQAGKKINELPLQELSGRRRASLMACDLRITLQNSAGLESLRTLLLSENRHLEEIDADFLPNLRHLRVLDLGQTRISVLPKSLGSLKHLRFLDISLSNIEELPETVCQLRHLQHLDVSWCQNLKKLPMEIGQLKCLTYLNSTGSYSIKFIPKAVSLLTSLETLRLPPHYDLLGGNDLRFEDLKDLANLRNFEGLWNSSEKLQMVPEGIFRNMHKMRDLFLMNDKMRYNEGTPTRLPSDMESMCELESVRLFGHVPADCLSSFASLVSLTLQRCNCKVYPRLDRLPNLGHLQLWTDESCEKLPEQFGGKGGFRKLEELNIVRFQKLTELPELENGAMQMLKKLSIASLPYLKKMPEGLNQLSTLQELSVHYCKNLPESEFEKLRTNIPLLKLVID